MYDALGDIIDTSCPIAWDHPHNKGLVAWWKIIPASGWRGGNKLRDLTRANDGTLTNFDFTTAWSPQASEGGSGSLLCDGTDDYVDVGNITAISAITIIANFNSNIAFTGGDFRALVAKRNGIGNATAWAMDVDFSRAAFRFYVNNGGFTIWTSANDTAVSGSWQTVAATYAGSGLASIYVNGKPIALQSGGAGPAILNDSSPARIGWFYNASGVDLPWSGLIDDIKIYSRALSSAEVWTYSQLSRQGYPEALNRVWTPKWVAAATTTTLFRRSLTNRTGSRSAA